MKKLKNKKFNKFIVSILSILTFNNAKKRRELRNEIQNIYKNEKKAELKQLINSKYSNDYCFFSRYGLGDIFYFASLLKEFKKKNSGRIIYFTEKRGLIDFIKMFTSIDEVVYDQDLKFLHAEQTLQKSITKGELNKIFFPYFGKKETYTFSDNYTNLLNLPLDTKREIPIPHENSYLKAQEEFLNLGLNSEKTILIIPDATMFNYKKLNSAFWTKLINKLQDEGYDIVFNTKLKEFKNYKNSFLPIVDFIAFAKQVKHIIALRSGICDLFAGMDITNMSILYPQQMDCCWADAPAFRELHSNHTKLFDNEFDNIFNIHSINSNFRTNKFHEVIYNYDDEFVIKDILEHIR